MSYSVGADVNKLLETALYGVDLSLFRLKVSNAPSYIQKFDNIDNYIDVNSSLVLNPAVRRGGKSALVKKKMEKATMLKNKVDEKANISSDHTLPDVTVMEQKLSKFIQDIETAHAIFSCPTWCPTRMPKKCSSDVPDVSILFLFQMIWVRFECLTHNYFQIIALSQNLVLNTTFQLGKQW